MTQESITHSDWTDKPIPKAPETPERTEAVESASDIAWHKREAGQQELEHASNERVQRGLEGQYLPIRIHTGDSQGNQLPVVFRPEMPDQGPTVKR